MRSMTTTTDYRARWGENLRHQLDAHGWSVREFQSRLRGTGVDVSTQTIYSWLKGDTAPRPNAQGRIADVLGAHAHLLFPVAS